MAGRLIFSRVLIADFALFAFPIIDQSVAATLSYNVLLCTRLYYIVSGILLPFLVSYRLESVPLSGILSSVPFGLTCRSQWGPRHWFSAGTTDKKCHGQD